MLIFGSRSITQLKRFCIVGLTCYVANVLAMAALCELAHVNYAVANIVVFIFGCVLGYWLNKRFTFELHMEPDRGALLRYMLINCAILALSTAALYVLVERCHVWYLGAVTLVAALGAPISFVVHRVVSYRMTT